MPLVDDLRSSSPVIAAELRPLRAELATRELIDFLVAEKKMNRDEAYILCSVAADLHVTQLVDGTRGVHAMLAKSIFTR